MGFDLKKFDKAKFEPRTEQVPVPALASFFSEGEKPEFTIRGLEGEEMARVNEAQSKHSNIQAVIDALVGKASQEKVEALQKTLGLSNDMPSDLIRRVEILRIGCVEPKLDAQLAAKIFRVAPVEAYDLSSKIQILSGQGMRLGEPKASGKKQTSKQPSTSDTPEASSSTK